MITLNWTDDAQPPHSERHAWQAGKIHAYMVVTEHGEHGPIFGPAGLAGTYEKAAAIGHEGTVHAVEQLTTYKVIKAPWHSAQLLVEQSEEAARLLMYGRKTPYGSGHRFSVHLNKSDARLLWEILVARIGLHTGEERRALSRLIPAFRRAVMDW